MFIGFRRILVDFVPENIADVCFPLNPGGKQTVSFRTSYFSDNSYLVDNISISFLLCDSAIVSNEP